MKEIELKVYTRNDSKIAKENFALGWERGAWSQTLKLNLILLISTTLESLETLLKLSTVKFKNKLKKFKKI